MKNLLNLLWKIVKVKIDRPLWSKHPEYNFIYPINYWYIEWLLAWDWDEQDVYVLWVNKPLSWIEWKVIAIINRKDDNEDKLVITEKWKNFTKEKIVELIDFQEKYFDSEIIM